MTALPDHRQAGLCSYYVPGRSIAADEPHEPTDAEIDAVVAEFGGDMRAAIRALMHDVALLAAEFSRSVSRGYVRGRGVLSLSRSADRKAE